MKNRLVKDCVYKLLYKTNKKTNDGHYIYAFECKVCGEIVERKWNDAYKIINCRHNGVNYSHLDKKQKTLIVEYVKKIAKNKMNKEIADLVNEKFGTQYSVNMISCLKKYHGIKSGNRGTHKAYNKKEIGEEYTRKDGLKWIKIENNKWQSKSRYMYEKYHNTKVPKDCKVVFLNGDRNDFSKENLFMANSKDTLLARNFKLYTKDRELTKTGILIAKLHNITQEKERLYEK